MREKIRDAISSGVKLPAKTMVAVYDAKRRFDAEALIVGYKNIHVSNKKQRLLHIKLSRTPIAGFRDNELKRIHNIEKGDPDVELYLNEDFIPIWGHAEAGYGTATIKLK